MNVNLTLFLFQFAVLLFSLSLHESAHAWMAWRLGDPTARMLGRITLNPAKHIDPLGTIVLPILGAFAGAGIFGWAKPTPVTTRNFKHFRRDDILVTLAGPASNILAAVASLLVLLLVKHLMPGGLQAIGAAATAAVYRQMDPGASAGALFPIALLFYYGIFLNLLLAFFNLLPFPPLDGSHVFRHIIPLSWTRVYDSLGMFSIFFIFLFGGRIISPAVFASLGFFNHIISSM